MGRTLDPGGTPVSQFFIYDNDRIVQELDGSGNLVAEWVYGSYIDEIYAMYRNTDGVPGFETYYYIQDDQYNVVALTDDEGQVVERYSYDDYGAPTVWIEDTGTPGTWIQHNGSSGAPESSIGNPFLFTGRRWDSELRLYDYRTRYYDPALGRFLRKDTIGLWGDPNNLGNPYAYVGNNPWSGVDPWGDFGNYPGLARDVELSNETIKAGWNKLSPKTRNRITGSVGLAGGMAETSIGLAATGLCGGGTVLSCGTASPASVPAMFLATLVAAHGLDVTSASYAQVWTGEYHKTCTAQTVEFVTGSEYAGAVVDMAFSMFGSGWAGLRVAGARNATAFLDDVVDDACAAKPCLAPVPGRVQSRINISNEGWAHVTDTHMNPVRAASKSQWTLSQEEVRSLLTAESTVKTPVRPLTDSGNFARTVIADDVMVGNLKQGGGATNVFTVITDAFGNLLSAFPGEL